jgi:DNA excision repair protein ERCC-2
VQPTDPPAYTVAVRALCEFAAKAGDLDLRFTPSPTSQEGIAGHKAVAARRGAGYESELALEGRYRHLRVRGRADGYDAAQQRVEEVKTFKGELQRQPANHRALHWAQAKVYGWLLCERHALSDITVSLVYFDVSRQQETRLDERCSADELRAFFEALCERFVAWADQELSHRAQRDAALNALGFPHAEFRRGQRPLATAVFNAARAGRCLMAQAPTGIGKTLGTIFPLLKACPGQSLDKLFFLAAKGPGRALALEALGTLRRHQPAMPLRVIELVAREKSCEHPDKACHGDSCPLAKGFYDRLPAARADAVSRGALDQPSLREVALSHEVCPYYLSQELARWADVVVGDYNYFFDGSALLHSLALEQEWRVGVLVDEAHNLVERARGMYSAELSQAALRTLRRTAPAVLKKPLDKLHRAWSAFSAERTLDYEVLGEPPSKLCQALREAVAAVTELMAEQPTFFDADVQRFYFDALQFTRLLDSFGPHSLFDATLEARSRSGKPRTLLCIRNVLPAPFLAPRFEAAHTAVLFSATLAPQRFYADALGLPEDTAWVDVESPFSADQLTVRIVRDVSTRYQHRARSLDPIAALMAAQYRERPGNYLAFFSSFEYLQQAAERFAAQHPDIPMWPQARQMNEGERRAFVERFAPGGCGIGFAVLGGAFAEGIDLAGDRLIGAFVATLGLPQLNPVNEEMRRRLDETFGAGYDYVYLYPGLRKVVQAAGRVIRTPQDRGTLYLIDDRFAREEVRRLLPSWWRVELWSALRGPARLAILGPTKQAIAL